jgi:hypothetical protein
MLQVGALVGAIGMQCKVGDCLYDPPPPPKPAPEPSPGPGPGPIPAPTPQPEPPLPPPDPENRIGHPEAYALGAVAVMLMMFTVVVGFFVRFDMRRAAGCEGLWDFSEGNDDMLAAADMHELAPLIRSALTPRRTHPSTHACMTHAT